MTDESASAPQRHLIDSREALHSALSALYARTVRRLRIASRDGQVFDLASRATSEAFERLLLSHREARVRVLVDDASWIERAAPRLKALQRRFPLSLELRVASSDDPVGDETCVIGDDRDLLMLQATAHPRGDCWLQNAPRVQPVAVAYDRRWDGGAHNLPVTPLGL